ncbi:uncharacterized protein LOC132742299 [Ruditapes philippinarum]|jgi:hypothetical protein|uniref:uncharacterized protein LOC132742299 n=1 Tax=Ruditapes philippinarum TaxID=129788 RepID=UPI00295B1AC6|nr:uncharacterized protein LOC132742299 [Ruditapes philippinarum]
MTILHSSSGRPYCSTDAKVQAVLPQLSEMRLVALTKQLSRNRKQLYLTQGNLETELVKTKHQFAREHKLSEDTYTHISGPFKKSLFHVRGVQKCLERRKTELLIDNAGDRYGQYGGLEVKSLKGEIDIIMKDHSYQNMKMKECKRILAESKADGRIMNINMCLPVLEAILNRPSMPVRRERALGFDSVPSTAESARVRRTSFKLPPVTASRLFTPSKRKRDAEQIPVIIHVDRANTVI